MNVALTGLYKNMLVSTEYLLEVPAVEAQKALLRMVTEDGSLISLDDTVEVIIQVMLSRLRLKVFAEPLENLYQSAAQKALSEKSRVWVSYGNYCLHRNTLRTPAGLAMSALHDMCPTDHPAYFAILHATVQLMARPEVLPAFRKPYHLLKYEWQALRRYCLRETDLVLLRAANASYLNDVALAGRLRPLGFAKALLYTFRYGLVLRRKELLGKVW